jgi:hypothetical protein
MDGGSFNEGTQTLGPNGLSALSNLCIDSDIQQEVMERMVREMVAHQMSAWTQSQASPKHLNSKMSVFSLT